VSDACLNCGGLIFDPGEICGYAGKVCHCPINPAHLYQRPASKKMPKVLFFNTKDGAAMRGGNFGAEEMSAPIETKRDK
jgi:hypothetical protein